MKHFMDWVAVILGMVLIVLFNGSCTTVTKIDYPETPKISFEENLHGTLVKDDYLWLEDDNDGKVKNWTRAQDELTRSLLESLPQRDWLKQRFNALWRYDDEGVPNRVLKGDRIFFRKKKKEDEHWVYCTKENENAESLVLFNPNQWGPAETLAFATPSRDGKYVAFGKAKGGNEDPQVHVMEIPSKRILPDTLRGWRRGAVAWLPDNSGFFYGAFPRAGEVPEGQEYYWHSVYFHELGTAAEEDKKVFGHDSVKEYFHWAGPTEDGKYVLFYRAMYNKTEVYFKKIEDLHNGKPPMPIVTGFDAQYTIDVINDRFFIQTDLDAPKGKVYVTDIDKREKKHWKEFLPETEDNLLYVSGIYGNIYCVYSHNVYTQIKIYTPEGQYLRDMNLPTIGNAQVWGYWSRDEVWVSFSSFTYPDTVFKYHPDEDELELYHRPPIDVDVTHYEAEQVWYTSKDGTQVSMFLIHHKDLKKNGNNPALLTGYGGFNVSVSPRFSTLDVVWLEAGGMIAVANLRGGGEYGQEWHRAGMREKKQNVFDDFIAAAEWLIENKYTRPEKLAISGASNGGLLVGAVLVQRPDLFKAVACLVPVLDMVRYHKFGYGELFVEEYGNAKDPEQFKYLYEYSPYHNVLDGTDYPAVLITAGENDARLPMLHSRKMAARLQEANPEGKPALLMINQESGHSGGTTLSTQIDQLATIRAFLMDQLEMSAPEG